MNNILLLPQLKPIPYCSEKAIVIHLNRSDYLKDVAGMLIKIDPQMTLGARYKLVCGDNHGYYYLYSAICDRGYFTKSL
ncbi:MAG: hypothetical protein RMY28_009360 [Nostoc sp. ChiSLP01]|nr:hypothetical protein [Nostoc sp. CmiSLP01]